MFVMVTLLQVLEVLYLIRYDKGMVDNDTCAHAQKMYLGAIYCLFYTICVMQAIKNATFFRQVTKFVEDGILPSQKVLDRNRNIAIAVAALSLIDYIMYTII